MNEPGGTASDARAAELYGARGERRLRARLGVWAAVAGIAVAALVAVARRGATNANARAGANDGARTTLATEVLVPDGESGTPHAFELRFGGWSPLFRGIELGFGESPMGRAGMQKIAALRVHLDEPGIALHVTEGNGEEPLETTAETTLAFLERTGLSVAVNAHFFKPCCESKPEPKDLSGLLYFEGDLISPPERVGTIGGALLVLGLDHRAAIVEALEPPDYSSVRLALAGSHVLVRSGQLAVEDNERTESHPRTAVGVSDGGRTLYLVTIDGRQIGWSNGATLRETAAWLRFLGAEDALNLDGGGSTTRVRSEEGRGVIVNRPVGLRIPGTLRWNGSNLGVVAAPLPAASEEQERSRRAATSVKGS